MSLWKQPPQAQGTRQPKGCWGQGCGAGSALLADWRWPRPVLSDPCTAGLTLIIPPRQYLPLLPNHRQLNSAQTEVPCSSPAHPGLCPGPSQRSRFWNLEGQADKARGLHEQQPQAVSPWSWLPAALQEGPGAQGREEPSGQGSKGLLLLVRHPPHHHPAPCPTAQFLKLYLSCLAFLS